MKDLIKAIVIDMIMFVFLAVSYFNILGVGQLAENAISSLGVFCLVGGSLVMLTYKSTAARGVDKYKDKGGFYYAYRAVTAAIKITVVAAFGWYWVASGFFIAYIGSSMSIAETKKLVAQQSSNS